MFSKVQQQIDRYGCLPIKNDAVKRERTLKYISYLEAPGHEFHVVM